MKRYLLAHRRGVSEILHTLAAAGALIAGFLLRFEFTIDAGYRQMLAAALPITVGVKLVVFRLFGLRDLAWRYTGFEDLVRLAAADVAASAAVTVVLRVAIGDSFPRSIYILDLLVCTAFLSAARVGARVVLSDYPVQTGQAAPVRRILIYGAGQAGRTLLGEIRALPELGYQVTGFLDDDPEKRSLRINGLRVLGAREELPALARRHRVDEILLAVPAVSGSVIAEILEACHAAGVSAKRIPRLDEWIDSKVLVDQIREVRIEDLLGRPEVLLDESRIRQHIEGRIVLITGAGGSVGSELCRQMARFRPQSILGLDCAETALYHIDQEMRERFPRIPFRAVVGNLQNRTRLRQIYDEHRPQVVYHAAAYKHVPMMEAHPFEAVENNVFGTGNLMDAAADFGVEVFTLISSDKAVRPANIMGATKRISEMLCQSAACAAGCGTRFLAVRFGNVLGSSGSVVPLFRKQIASGGPVTVTHPEMRRYFMTIPEAAQLVLQAGSMGSGGEIFVLEMGEQVRIVDLARKMILLSGLKPDHDIQIEFSGTRPGEKLCEELNLKEEQTRPTHHAQIRMFCGPEVAPQTLSRCLAQIRETLERRDTAQLVLTLKELIPDYNPSAFVLRRALGRAASDPDRTLDAFQDGAGSKVSSLPGAQRAGGERSAVAGAA